MTSLYRQLLSFYFLDKFRQGLFQRFGGIFEDTVLTQHKPVGAEALEQPAALDETAAVDEGNGILGHIFGSKDVSRQVAARAAESSGVDSSILKKMLPMLASVAMGAMAKQGFGSGSAGQAAGDQGGGFGGLLAGFLDADKDGSILDDVLGMAGRHERPSDVGAAEGIDAALDRVGLLAAARKRYRAYSLGMRQRLALAAALLCGCLTPATLR